MFRNDTAGVTSCSARANRLLCSGMASVWKWNSDSGLLEQAGSEKAPEEAEQQKTPMSLKMGLNLTVRGCEGDGEWQWELCPFSAFHMSPCTHCQGLLCLRGAHSPFHAVFISANKSESLLQLFGIETLTHQPLGCPEKPHLGACSTNWAQSRSTGMSGWVVMPVPWIFQFLQIHLFVH